MIGESERQLLLMVAREALGARLGAPAGGAPPAPCGVLAIKGAAFVTLHQAGELRGCIGHLGDDEALVEVVARCAVAAGTDDPRFAPITAAELPQLRIEISILGPLEALESATTIEVGRHGLVVEQHGRRGLLLPQVAIEWNWNVETFLAHTCHKAGLPRDAWRNGARIWRFEADVFGEGGTDGRTGRAARPD